MKIWIEKYKTFFIGLIVIVLAVFLFVIQPKNNRIFTEGSLHTIDPGILETEEEGLNKEQESVIQNIYVDLKGAVKNPGIYLAKEGERVFDIVERSGGLLDHADENNVNFAEKIEDEMVIYIPEIGEMDDVTIANASFQSSKTEKINLNKADSKQLETLPGVGPAKAAAIIEYRENNGPFKQIEDLMNVSGFGPKTFEKLEELISVR